MLGLVFNSYSRNSEEEHMTTLGSLQKLLLIHMPLYLILYP